MFIHMTAEAQLADTQRDRVRILVVDDSRVIRKAVEKILGGDFEILEAEDGEAGKHEQPVDQQGGVEPPPQPGEQALRAGRDVPAPPRRWISRQAKGSGSRSLAQLRGPTSTTAQGVRRALPQPETQGAQAPRATRPGERGNLS